MSTGTSRKTKSQPNDSAIPGPGIGYVDILDVSTLDKIEVEAKDVTKYFPLRPSAAGKCTRELAYDVAEYYGKGLWDKPLMSPSTYRLLRLGHSIEWNLLKQFEDIQAFKCRYQQQQVDFVRLDEDTLIEGSMDVCFISEQWRCVVDVKSKKDKFSKYFSTAWDEIDAKLDENEHVQRLTPTTVWVEDLDGFVESLYEQGDPFFAANFLQLNIYALSRFALERRIDHAAIIQYNKNDSRLREVRFKPSESLLKRTEMKMRTAYDAGKKGTPQEAPRDFMLGTAKCAFCPRSTDCWDIKDGVALKDWFKTWPKKQWPKDTIKMGQDGKRIEELSNIFVQKEGEGKERLRSAELEATKLMLDHKVKKIRLKDGSVYALKELKSSKYPHVGHHFSLERSKA